MTKNGSGKQNKLRIALVTTEFVGGRDFAGGLANYTYHIALALAQAGHDVVVFIEGERNERRSMDGFTLIQVGLRQQRALSLLNGLSLNRLGCLIGYLRLSWNLNRAIREEHIERPFQILQYTQLGGVGLFRLSGVPTVVRLSSYNKLWRKHGEFFGLNRFYVWQIALVEKMALYRADAIFGPCRNVTEFVARDLGKPVAVIETPFNGAAIKPDDQIFDCHLREKKYLLYYGRLSPAKGILVLGEILQDLLRQFPDCLMVLVGRETKGWRREPIMTHIRRQADDLNDRVIHLDNLPQTQLFAIIRHAHVVVFPALVENFPNACLEAMYCKRVIVATSGTGFDQLLRHGESGLLCPPGDAQALLKTIRQAVELDEIARQEMGQAAYIRLHDFSPEKIAQAHGLYYQQVIAAKLGGERKGKSPYGMVPKEK